MSEEGLEDYWKLQDCLKNKKTGIKKGYKTQKKSAILFTLIL